MIWHNDVTACGGNNGHNSDTHEWQLGAISKEAEIREITQITKSNLTDHSCQNCGGS